MEKLVSILTPCYNGEKYLDRYFGDILSQDYPNCEIIFMDDGSTDNTRKITEKYRPKVEGKGYTLKYYYHDNIGVGGTINAGVKHISGEYFVWPDCDDGMSPNCISKKVDYLENHPGFGAVRTNGVVEDENRIALRDVVSSNNTMLNDTRLFDDYLFGRGAWLQPGSFMIRTSAFDRANPDRFIFPSRRGQNWQILLPVFYYYDCGYINEKLFQYVKHSGNLSDTQGFTFDQAIHMQEQFEEIIIQTIKHMNIPDGNEYMKKVQGYYLKKKITVAFLYDKRQEAKTLYRELSMQRDTDWKAFIKANLTNVPFSKMLFRKLVGK